MSLFAGNSESAKRGSLPPHTLSGPHIELNPSSSSEAPISNPGEPAEPFSSHNRISTVVTSLWRGSFPLRRSTTRFSAGIETRRWTAVDSQTAPSPNVVINSRNRRTRAAGILFRNAISRVTVPRTRDCSCNGKTVCQKPCWPISHHLEGRWCCFRLRLRLKGG